jgi:hypothetical protein
MSTPATKSPRSTFKVVRVYADPFLPEVVTFVTGSKAAADLRLAYIERCSSPSVAYHYEIWETHTV